MENDYLILTEKETEFEAFKKALGGSTGVFNNHTFQLVHSQGHLLEFDEPENQVSPALKNKYKSWNLEDLLWNLNDFNWKKVPKRDKKTGKTFSYVLKLLKTIKEASKNAKAIVIATDTDYSTGEGELIAWEIINEIGWHGPVYREYHDDEGVDAIRKAMANLHDVSIQNKDGWYVKASVRNRWDFGSLPLTRAATTIARMNNFYVTAANQGRLKSVMLSLVFQRLEEIKHYVKKPYYEVKFKDDLGNTYSRIRTENDPNTGRYSELSQAKEELKKYASQTTVIVDEKELRNQSPHTLIDLAKIDGILSKKGYPSKMIQDVYQELYQKGYLSYPRTEDQTITQDQFDELVNNRNDIAKLVEVDLSLLTHLTPRKKIVVKSATHGANRPGHKIPESLGSLKRFFSTPQEKQCALDIYELVAKSALAILGEDYQYNHFKAHLTNYPNFVCSYNQPVKIGYRKIYGTIPKMVKDPDTVAKSFIDKGVNPKPKIPNKDWVYKKLSSYKYSVGTAATQQSTMTTITDKESSSYLMTDKKGQLGLTKQGLLSALLARNTYIASPQVTIQLFQGMQAVGNFKLAPERLLATVNQVIQHDLPIMVENSKDIKNWIKPVPKKNPGNYVQLHYQGKVIQLKRTWGKHTFTNDELKVLEAGEKISFKYGRRKITGQLGPQKYHGKTYINFIADFGNKKG